MSMLSSPSAVWTDFGRVPLREPLASAVRWYRARPRNAVTSSSTARCKTRRAPSRPSSANFSAFAAEFVAQQLSYLCLEPGTRRYSVHLA